MYVPDLIDVSKDPRYCVLAIGWLDKDVAWNKTHSAV